MPSAACCPALGAEGGREGTREPGEEAREVDSRASPVCQPGRKPRGLPLSRGAASSSQHEACLAQ